MIFCKDCEFIILPKEISPNKEMSDFEIISKAECKASAYFEYVTGKEFYFYCKIKNSDGHCGKYKEKEGV